MSLKLSVNEENNQEQKQDQKQQNIMIENKPFGQKCYQFDALTAIKIWAYGIGHFFNDLGGASFFNYLVFYYKTILKLECTPYALFAGQIVDAISTPLVGYYSDKVDSKIGKRKPSYILGTSIMIICFPLMFNDSNNFFSDGISPIWFQRTYYIFFNCVINIGFAAVQVSHMSLVTSLTCSRKRRDKLTSLRNTFTFLAFFLVLLIALALFKFMENTIWEFQILSYIVTGIGFSSSLFFIININEVYLTQKCQEYTNTFMKLIDEKKKKIQAIQNKNQDNNQQQGEQTQYKDENTTEQNDLVQPLVPKKKSYIIIVENEQGESMININQKEVTNWKVWFGETMFYQFGFVFMGVRIYCNVFSTLVNFYLCFVLKYAADENELLINPPIEIALIPLTLYLSSVGISSVLPKLFNTIGRKKTFSIGGVLMLATAIILFFLNEKYRYFIYFVAVMSGVSQAICLNTSITLISEVIGIRGADGAFVYGAYGFLDRLSTGIALFFLTNTDQLYNADFLRYTITIIPGVGCIIAWILIIISKVKDYGDKKEEKKNKSLKKNKSSVIIGSRISSLHFLDEFAN